MNNIAILTTSGLYGKATFYRSLHTAVKKHQPDIVALVGDFLNGVHSTPEFGRLDPSQCAASLTALPCSDVVLVRGDDEGPNWAEFTKMWRGFGRPLAALHGESHVCGPLRIVGFPCRLGDDTAYRDGRPQLPPNDMEWLAKLMRRDGPAARAIWLMHEPPAWTPFGIGSAEWTEAIDRFRPLLVVCGHQHDEPVRRRVWRHHLGRTLCINVGQCGTLPLRYAVVEVRIPSSGYYELEEPRLPSGIHVTVYPDRATVSVSGMREKGNPEWQALDLGRRARHDDFVGLNTILRAGADPNALDVHRLTPLQHAASRGHNLTVRVILRHGADPDGREDPAQDATPLMLAAQGGRTGTVKILLEAGADPNPICSDEAATPLMSAAHHGLVEMARLLLDSGARLETFQACRHPHSGIAGGETTALMVAERAAQWRMVRFLLDAGARDTITLFDAAQGGDLTRVRQEVRKGAGVNELNENGLTALQAAVHCQRLEVARELLRANASCTAPSSSGAPSPLILAARNADLAMVGLLIEAGASADGNDRLLALRPLHSAVEKKALPLFAPLVEAGADSNAWNESGETALWIAVQQGHAASVRELLRLGADPNCPCCFDNDTGDTPVTLARATKRQDLRDILDR